MSLDREIYEAVRSLDLAVKDVVARLSPDDVKLTRRILAVRDMTVEKMLDAYMTAVRGKRDRAEEPEDEAQDEEGG